MVSLRRTLLPALSLLTSLALLAGPATPTADASAGAGAGRVAAKRTGPPLGVPAAALAKSLVCSSNLNTQSGIDPVLLVPGTTLDAATNYDWNYEVALKDAGIPWCAVTVPNHGMTDIQVAGAYITNAIRKVHSTTGEKVRIIGYSQGGMSPRWSLKYWPDTRAMVSDLIAIDPSNHGTYSSVPLCASKCAPSFRQQTTGSTFLKTLNKGAETYAGIDYTNVYTLTDEVVTPNLGPAASSSLHTGKGDIANISVQSICPTEVADHLTMGTTDPVAWAVAYDALRFNGPAKASRVNRGSCLAAYMPGVSVSKLPANEARYLKQIATSAVTSPMTASEPALKAYAR